MNMLWELYTLVMFYVQLVDKNRKCQYQRTKKNIITLVCLVREWLFVESTYNEKKKTHEMHFNIQPNETCHSLFKVITFNDIVLVSE